jgi:Rrf2 family protein
MRVSAKANYAVRAGAELAAAQAVGPAPVKGERIAEAQGIPHRFLENILAELRNAGLVHTRRGTDGGYSLARPAAQITIADVMRCVEGPLAAVQGSSPEELEYPGAARRLPEAWVALQANLRAVLEAVSLADLAAGFLPASVTALADETEASATAR